MVKKPDKIIRGIPRQPVGKDLFDIKRLPKDKQIFYGNMLKYTTK